MDEKPYSMPPATFMSFGFQKEDGNVAPENPRYTLHAAVNLDNLMTQELTAWIDVTYRFPRQMASKRCFR
eukprot:5660562-Prymnesium_polylepis.2